MRPFLAAAVVALLAPGTAAGAGLSLSSRTLAAAERAPVRVARFDLVGLHWRGKGTLLFRTRSAAGRWSAWQPALAEEDDLPDRGTVEARQARGWRLGSPFWTGGATAIQYRSHGRVRQVRAFFVRSPRVRSRVRLPAIAGAPPMVTRAGWRADESIRRGAPFYADGVHLAFVHHTAGSNSYTRTQSASIVRAIELYHVKGNGWNDIGYNFLVDKYGQVFEGRYGGMTRPVVGAHAMGFNSGSAGIALIGNYGSTPITPAARAALVSLLAWRLDLAHVDPASSVVRISSGNPRYPAGRAVTLRAVSGHRDAYPTSCPGASLYSQLPSLRAAVARTGLPKLYSPAVTGVLGSRVRFTGRLSNAVAWVVTLRDAARQVVASGSGTGTRVDWTWDSSRVPPGRYSWAITAPNLRPASGSIGSAPAPFALDRLRISPTVLSPNGDGRGEQARVEYRLSTRATVTAAVQDAFGTTVATLFTAARAAGSQSLTWSPSGLSDGWYWLVLTATAGPKQAQARTPFWVDRTLAAVAATSPAISPNGDGTLETLGLSFRLLAPARVNVRILRGSTVVATLLEADLGAGPAEVSWDGSGLPDGSYRAAVSATDSLTTVTQTLPVRIDRKPPSLRLVSPARLLFLASEPGLLVVAVNGRWRRVTVRRAGYVRPRPRGEVRGVTAVLVDAAGNRSRVVRARR
jgi:N-acetylmuramoyl-L-alanine amidase